MVHFRVYGTPAPQGSKKGFIGKHTGCAVLIDDNRKSLLEWRKQVSIAAKIAYRATELLSGPLFVSIKFYLKAPAKIPKNRLGYPAVKPDLDKLERAAWDAMTGIIFDDDGQIVSNQNEKVYGEPLGAEIIVCHMPKIQHTTEDSSGKWRQSSLFDPVSVSIAASSSKECKYGRRIKRVGNDSVCP